MPKDKLDSVACLSYVGPTFNHISRVLSPHNVKSYGLPPRKISMFLRPLKDDLGVRTPRAYIISFECDQVYIKQTHLSIDTSWKERIRHIRLEHPDDLAVAEHAISLEHRIQLHNISFLFINPR